MKCVGSVCADFPHPVDFAQNVDLAGPTATCGELVDCGNACTTQSCLTTCTKSGTVAAQAAYRALGNCIDVACPSQPIVDGGANMACAFNSAGMLVDKAACDACVSKSQMTGGACKTELDACTADGA
jgi:hypothetical protein